MLVLALSVSLQFCSSSKKTTSTTDTTAPSVPVVSYAKQIQPIILAKCTPCHFPDSGKKKPLDTYHAMSSNIKGVLRRVQLSEEDPGFMPFKKKKEPLTQAEIQLLKDWAAGNMPE